MGSDVVDAESETKSLWKLRLARIIHDGSSRNRQAAS
jgi:hypothetical protein